MRLEFKPITANNIATFNAYVNAVRCDGFTKFVSYYKEELPALFKNVTIFESEQKEDDIVVTSTNNKGKDLSVAYSSLSIPQLRTVYEQVVQHRSQEFAGVFAEKEIKFKDLEKLDKIKYELLFNYGDKLGGYGVIASLDIVELITIYNHFVYLQSNQNKAHEELFNKTQ